MQAAKRLNPVIFSLPLAYHGYARNSVRKTGDEMRQTGPICDLSTRTQSHSNNIISSCSQGTGRRKSVTDLAHVSEQKFDGLKTQISTQISSHSYFPFQHSPISCYSFVPRVVFHFQRSLHCVSWKAEVLERSRESWGSSLVQTVTTAVQIYYQQAGCGMHCYLGAWPWPGEK